MDNAAEKSDERCSGHPVHHRLKCRDVVQGEELGPGGGNNAFGVAMSCYGEQKSDIQKITGDCDDHIAKAVGGDLGSRIKTGNGQKRCVEDEPLDGPCVVYICFAIGQE